MPLGVIRWVAVKTPWSETCSASLFSRPHLLGACDWPTYPVVAASSRIAILSEATVVVTETDAVKDLDEESPVKSSYSRHYTIFRYDELLLAYCSHASLQSILHSVSSFTVLWRVMREYLCLLLRDSQKLVLWSVCPLAGYDIAANCQTMLHHRIELPWASGWYAH